MLFELAMIRMLKDSGNDPGVAKCVYVAPTKVSWGLLERFFVALIGLLGSMLGKIQRMDEEVFWPGDHV